MFVFSHVLYYFLKMSMRLGDYALQKLRDNVKILGKNNEDLER